ncbi:MAG: substrate-binding domain-containing protein [Chloroflexi bacterium]|nr:substrate-binding domain-containing protein [Chloroflexota bacterium]
MALKHIRKGRTLLAGILLIIVLASTVLTGCGAETPVLEPKARLKLATTTSLYDTGLWGHLETLFEKKYGVELDILYAGTGKALELGRRGDVDVLAVHDLPSEERFIADGYGVKRVPFAYNYFIIVGPSADPAGIKGLSPEAAFIKVKETSGAFVSRGDDSGTHAKEKAIWKAAGLDYEMVRQSGQWYIEAGSGMGPTLMMASEKRAYTLTDIGTFLAYKGKLDLVPLVDKGETLLNVYAAIAVNPEKVKGVNYDMANNLIGFLTSTGIQKLIGDYGVKEYGTPLFSAYSDEVEQ